MALDVRRCRASDLPQRPVVAAVQEDDVVSGPAIDQVAAFGAVRSRRPPTLPDSLAAAALPTGSLARVDDVVAEAAVDRDHVGLADMIDGRHATGQAIDRDLAAGRW